MDNYTTPERKEYIGRLERQIESIDRILQLDSGSVIGTELEEKLRELKSEASTILRKLKNDEFEIVIVGMEKAGKSTFANALMENILLPAKDARCTFTSTRIEYSGDGRGDSATVSFYSVDTFNRDFKDKLCKIGFPNYDRYSFDTINEDMYVSVYESKVSDEKKNLYEKSIHEDILAIIRNVSSISSLLGKPDVTLDSIHSDDLADYITNESKAWAVKQVIIHSSKLSEMKNAIIFDVPGFNSPTELHKIQTRERMKSADAIVVVANGKSPSLTGESLKILNESDDEGNPLSDKLFVYANQIELADSIKTNINDTYEEWIGKGFVHDSKRHRIVCGSALAHLQKIGKSSDDRILRLFKERETELPQGDGIDTMRNELAEYNYNERFEVLKRRVNRLRADLVKAFGGINTDHTDSSFSAEHIALASELKYEVCPKAEKELLELRDNIRTFMPAERPLSKRITNYITENVKTEKYGLSDKEIDEVKRKNLDSKVDKPFERIDGEVRELKFKSMYNEFSDNVVHFADDHHKKYSEQILDKMLDSMDVEKGSPYYDDLRGLLKQELSVFRGEFAEENNTNIYYQSLIERFSRDIYDILILRPYTSERLTRFYGSVDNFLSMSVFYRVTENDDELGYIDKTLQEQPLCMLLLFHHYINTADNIKRLSEKILVITGIKDMPDEVLGFIEKAYSAVGGDIDVIVKKLTNVFSKVGDKEITFLINLLEEKLNSIAKSNSVCSLSDREAFTAYYGNYHNMLRERKPYNEDFIKEEFDKDIEILRDVLTNAFVRAISMETPFVAREVKAIDDIVEYVKSGKFGRFLSDNFWKIKYQETGKLDRIHREREQNAAVIREINSILDTIEN